MIRRSRGGVVVLAVSFAVAMTACTELFGDRGRGLPDGVLIENETDETLVVTYEVTDEQRAGAQIDEVRLAPGAEEIMEPTPTDRDRCLLAPIVARTAGGRDEVARLPEGHCLGPDIESSENRFVVR